MCSEEKDYRACPTYEYNGQSTHIWCGLVSSVGVVTRYGLDVSGFETPVGARFSAPLQTCTETHQVCYTMGTGDLTRG